MIPDTLSSAVSFAQANGYFIIFLIMVFEGPMITTAAAFAASLGTFNIFFIFLLALLGDITGDFLFYGIGRFTRYSFINKYGHYIGINKTTVKLLEKKLHKHFVKTFIFVKNAPILCQPGLVAMGTLKVPAKKFFLWSFIITLPKSLFFSCLGYFGGVAIIKILDYFNLVQYAIPIAIIIGILVYYLINKFDINILKKEEKKVK